MTTIVTIGIDLAKKVFTAHGVNATYAPALVHTKQSYVYLEWQARFFVSHPKA